MPTKIRTRRPFVVIGVAALLVLAIRTGWAMFGPPLLINTTASEPVGVYWVRHRANGEYARGMRVVFPVPQDYKALVVERGWLAPGLPLIKHIGAVGGDRVCIESGRAAINDVVVGPVETHDSVGRPLPQIRGCLTVPPGYFFPLSTCIPNSFDGRYMGIQPLSVIVGEVIPAWTF